MIQKLNECLSLFVYIGNLLVLTAVGRYMKLTVMNLLISSMSASDLMSTLICCPLQVNIYAFNNTICNIYLRVLHVHISKRLLPLYFRCST